MAQKLSAPRKPQATSVPQVGSDRPRQRMSLGPQLGFAATVVLGCIAWSAARATLSPDAIVPVVCTFVLAMAALFALVAWRQRWVDTHNVTYRDVAGALTLIGICAAATIDPEQMVMLVQHGDSTD